MATPTSDAPFTLGLLWGGRSRRMGSDKALLPFGSATLVEWVVARCGGPDVPVIVACGASERPLPPGLHGVRQVRDVAVDAGPLAGLAALVRGCETRWVVAIPCDMPFVTRDDLEALIRAAEASDRPVAHHRIDERVLPFPCALRADAADVVDTCLAAGRGRVLSVWEAARGATSEVDAARAERLDVNLNDPDDYERARRRAEGTA